jgi:hypothetical protein
MERKPIERTILSKIMSEIAKESHRKSPRSKEFYQNMAKKSVESRRNKKKQDDKN